jgi:hypothetical protein
MGVPSSSQKTTLNYFLFNIGQSSSLSMKFEISIIYTQIEIGRFLQFFSTSLDTYGHLVFPSYCVQLWQELEPQGITLRPAEHITWTPSPPMPQ